MTRPLPNVTTSLRVRHIHGCLGRLFPVRGATREGERGKISPHCLILGVPFSIRTIKNYSLSLLILNESNPHRGSGGSIGTGFARANFKPQRAHTRVERAHPGSERCSLKMKYAKANFHFLERPDSSSGPSMAHFTTYLGAVPALSRNDRPNK